MFDEIDFLSLLNGDEAVEIRIMLNDVLKQSNTTNINIKCRRWLLWRVM